MGQPGEPYDPNPALPPHAYPPPGYYPYPNYPPGPYPGYPPPPPFGAQRPGVATAAAVLAYVAAGLLLAAAMLLFFGASVVNGLDELDESSHSVITAELVIDGILNMIAAGLLIAGAVSFTGRNPSGRVLLSVGCGIVIGESVYWIARSTDAIFWALVYAALVIVALSLAWSSSSNRWIREAG